MKTLYELEGAAIQGLRGKVIDPLDLSIRDRAITAIVGPVGSGKSTLLRVLSGRALPEGWDRRGEWRYRGRDLGPVVRGRTPLRDVAWVPQLRHGPAGAHPDLHHLATIRARLDAALFCAARVVLLDEPTRGLPAGDHERLIERIRDHAREGAGIVISHDLQFTRQVADDICLLCEGDLVTHCSADRFFERTDEELVAQFVRYGTCAYSAPLPDLPRHFRWLESGRLAGMGRPGILGDLDDDLFAVANAGVTLLVSLTEEALPTSRLRPFGIEGRHFPIRDMGVPDTMDTIALCHDLLRAMDRGQVVAVHCRAGLGRTGTILACVAVCGGCSAVESIDQTRRAIPSAIQTESQEAFIHAFSDRVGHDISSDRHIFS